MEDLVKEAVKDVNADEPCIDIQVTAGTVKDVVALLNDPNAELPEIWIPDSPTWKGQLTAAGWTGTPIADVLAQTPVGLIGGPSAKAPPRGPTSSTVAAWRWPTRAPRAPPRWPCSRPTPR